MRRQFVRLALCLFLLGGSVAYAQSGMTDNQVIEYVQQALQQGKDQQTIAMELLAKGATQEQLLRLKSQYSGAAGAQRGHHFAFGLSGGRRQLAVGLGFAGTENHFKRYGRGCVGIPGDKFDERGQEHVVGRHAEDHEEASQTDDGGYQRERCVRTEYLQH